MANDRLYLRHKKSMESLLLATHGGGPTLRIVATTEAVDAWMNAHLHDFGEGIRNLGFASPFELIVEAQLPGRYSTDPLDLVALSDARGEAAKLKADNARLRKLIADAEWEGNASREPEPACPWCQRDKYGVPREKHADDCPAFSAPGVVR